jgi:hypothetical protein
VPFQQTRARSEQRWATQPRHQPFLREGRRSQGQDARAAETHKPVGFWEPVVGLSNQLHYWLAWNEMADREVRWSAFQADPEWISKRDQSELSGPLAASIHNELWTPTSYSPLK